VWSGEPWARFAFRNADTRSVVTPRGAGELVRSDPLGATVRVIDVAAGDPIVIRTNYYPAWSAESNGAMVPLFSIDGQLAFRAPRAGSYDVQLIYPSRRWLAVVALLGLAVGMIALGRIGSRRVTRTLSARDVRTP
jgi:hypothetical protein